MSAEQDWARAREVLDRFDSVVLNIAITGETGAGKSSFVNAIRGVEDGAVADGAADVGVTETTKTCTMYPHPTMSNVRIWDLPGIGSDKFKAETYIKDVQFQNYDFFIIVNQKRFKENDALLAKEILKKKKNFYFVRSGTDSDVEAGIRQKKAEAQTLQTIRRECEEKLKELQGTSPPVFLISSWYPERYDFLNLLNALERDLPDNKRDALVLSVPVYSLQCLEKKYNTLKNKVWTLAVLSGGIGGLPIPGLSPVCDVGIVELFFTKCYFSFGLDDKSLIKLGKRVDKPILEMVKKSALVRAIVDKTFLSNTMGARLVAANLIEGICSLVPVAGNIAAAGVSYVTTKLALEEGLNELYKVAKQVIAMAGLN